MKNLILFSVIMAFSLLTSCKHEPSARPLNTISFVDFSPSRDTSVIRWYKEVIKHSEIEKMGMRDQLVALPIDFNSETSSQEIFKVNFSKNDYSNEFAGLQKDEIEKQIHMDSVLSAMQQFSQSFDTVRKARSTLKGGTDIFGALKQCKKYIVPGYRNIIVIHSDMLQFSDKANWNFEDHLNSTDEIEHYLSAAEKIDLTGVEIIVLCGAQNNMRPEKYEVIKAFWERYFQACNANLVDYSSGAITKLEETLGK